MASITGFIAGVWLCASIALFFVPAWLRDGFFNVFGIIAWLVLGVIAWVAIQALGDE